MIDRAKTEMGGIAEWEVDTYLPISFFRLSVGAGVTEVFEFFRAIFSLISSTIDFCDGMFSYWGFLASKEMLRRGAGVGRWKLEAGSFSSEDSLEACAGAGGCRVKVGRAIQSWNSSGNA